MSTTEHGRRRTRTAARERGAARGRAALPRVETPIVPRNSIAGRALVAVVAIMTFLASLTTGAVMLVRRGGERLAVGRRARSHHPGAAGAGPRHRRRRRARRPPSRAPSPGVAEVRAYHQGGIGASCWSRGSAAGLRSTTCRCRA